MQENKVLYLSTFSKPVDLDPNEPDPTVTQLLIQALLEDKAGQVLAIDPNQYQELNIGDNFIRINGPKKITVWKPEDKRGAAPILEIGNGHIITNQTRHQALGVIITTLAQITDRELSVLRIQTAQPA